MKLIHCYECSEPIALLHRWVNCGCGKSGGAYMPDGDCCVIAGTCSLYGISNKVFFGRAECWPYDETRLTKQGLPKVTRLADNPGVFPDRVLT